MNLLQEYGQELIAKNNLIDKRYIYYYDFELTHDNILKFCEEKLNRKINNYIIINKKFQDKQSLKYHIDDCQLVKIRTGPEYNQDKYIHIKDNYYLFVNNQYNKIPEATFIFYESTYDIDFTGGILVLSDKTNIYPKKNMCILIDGCEVHKVTPIINGKRKSTIVKMYG